MFPDAYPTHIGQQIARKHSNRPRLVAVTLPSQEMVGVYDYLSFMRIKEKLDQDLLLDKIQSAREVCEEYTGVTFGGAMYDMYFDFLGPYFSGWTNFRLAENYNIITIPKEPMVSVQGIWLRDSAGVETQLSTDMYNVSQSRRPGRITINTWPFMEVIAYPFIEQLRIRFTCGYVTPVTINTVSNRLTTQVPHGFSTAGATPLYNSVRFRATGTNVQGVMPAPLVQRVDYFAQVIDAYTYTLTTDSAGLSPVDLTTAGTGYIFSSLQEGGLPISLNRAILSVATRDRFAGEPRSLRAIDAQSDVPKEAASILKRFRKLTVT